VLAFENAAVRARLADAPKGGYQAAWFRFDNATGATQPIGSPTTAREERVQAPPELPRADGSFVKVSVAAVDPPHAAWAKSVDAYFRRSATGWQLVGLDRLQDSASAQNKPAPVR